MRFESPVPRLHLWSKYADRSLRRHSNGSTGIPANKGSYTCQTFCLQILGSRCSSINIQQFNCKVSASTKDEFPVDWEVQSKAVYYQRHYLNGTLVVLLDKAAYAGTGVHAQIVSENLMLEGHMLHDVPSNSLAECIGDCSRTTNCTAVVHRKATPGGERCVIISLSQENGMTWDTNRGLWTAP